MARPRVDGRVLISALVGLLCLAGAALCAYTAAGTESDRDALTAAKPCSVGAAWNAGCLREVEGSVSAVVLHTGRPPRYELRTSTEAGIVSAEFPETTLLVRRAMPRDAMLLTTWRGIVVAASAYGLRAVPSNLPTSGMQPLLAGLSALTGIAMCCLQGAYLFAFSYPGKLIKIRPARTFLAVMWSATGVILAVNGIILGFGLNPWIDLGVVGILLAAVACVTLRRPARKAKAVPERRPSRQTKHIEHAQRTRRQTAYTRREAITDTVYAFLGVGACAAVLYAYAECVPGRAHDHAPICRPGVTASACRSETTLQVRGERRLGATVDIIFIQPDGSAIVANFDHSQTLETAVQAAAATKTGLPVELWRGGIWEVHANGKGYLRPGDPRYEVAAIVLLATLSGAFLIMSRIRLRRRPRSATVPLPPWFEDAAQVALLIAGLAFLWEGHAWAGAFLAADAAWLIWSLATTRTPHPPEATRDPA